MFLISWRAQPGYTYQSGMQILLSGRLESWQHFSSHRLNTRSRSHIHSLSDAGKGRGLFSYLLEQCCRGEEVSAVAGRMWPQQQRNLHWALCCRVACTLPLSVRIMHVIIPHVDLFHSVHTAMDVLSSLGNLGVYVSGW